MNKRPSVYIGSSLEQIITDIQGYHDDKVSTVINTVADRYKVIIERNMPTLTESEWLALMDILNGYMTDNITQAVNGIIWSLRDSINLEGLDNKWDLPEDFVGRIEAMSFEQRLAIIHTGERFWSFAGKTENYNEMLLQCDAKIS